MLELLEKLSPTLDKQFKKEVAMEELTVLSVNLSAKSGMVLTNRAFYLLQKSFWKTRCDRVILQELQAIELEGRLKIQVALKSGQLLSAIVAPDKFANAVKAVNRILDLIRN